MVFIDDSNLQVQPPQSSIAPGTAFTAMDQAYVATSVTSRDGKQQIATRPAQRDEVIQSIDIDGDLDFAAIDLNLMTVEASVQARPLRSGPNDVRPLAAPTFKPTCTLIKDRLKSALDADCAIQYTTRDGRLSVGGNLGLKEVRAAAMKYSSRTSQNSIESNITGVASGAIDITFNAFDTSVTADSQVLVRIDIPIPGSFGFVSLRLPYAIEYKLPTPPVTGRYSFSATLAGSTIAAPQASLSFALASAIPANLELAVTADSFLRLFVGAELAATLLPTRPGIIVLPSSTASGVTIGTYFKAGPSGKLSWTMRPAGSLNCVQPELAVDMYSSVSTSARFLSLIESTADFSVKLSSVALYKNDFGSCVDRIAFDPSAATYQIGQPVDVSAFLRAYLVGGTSTAVPSGVTYLVSPSTGASVDQQSGVLTPLGSDSIRVNAYTPSGLSSNDLTLSPGFLQEYVQVRFSTDSGGNRSVELVLRGFAMNEEVQLCSNIVWTDVASGVVVNQGTSCGRTFVTQIEGATQIAPYGVYSPGLSVRETFTITFRDRRTATDSFSFSI